MTSPGPGPIYWSLWIYPKRVRLYSPDLINCDSARLSWTNNRVYLKETNGSTGHATLNGDGRQQFRRSGRRRTWWGFAPVAVAGQQPPRRRSRWQRRGRIRRQVCCERRHKDESIPIGRGNVELTISFLQWRSRKAGSARSAWRRGEMLN